MSWIKLVERVDQFAVYCGHLINGRFVWKYAALKDSIRL